METITKREAFLEKLGVGPCEVVFTKVDGSVRRMKCTVKPELIPDEKQPDPEKKHKRISEDTVPCYDLELGDWRSFRVDSVIDFFPAS